ncbi:PD-(D/E)XK nuclease family protein [Bradyrhizobium ontarionense]|uniref:PD-(D/E)XK nuclease family protein n=1 Tax=Bradyrhizobium ontarionense TaxID=2898149 RepID=A0ABY3RM86_9BRAD|nr:DNA translocase FtsK [Bradyrhizobium sp. A19]UFZ07961.1 PD-(D/E)XK nuclease family protein [Bradyrhizobium sp. A19]
MAHYSITATELTFAVLDPEWRARWLRDEKPSTKSFAPAGTARAMGVQFHKEVEKLVGWLTARGSLKTAARIDTVDALVDHVWTTSLQELTDKLFAAGRGEDAAAFTERMRHFCARLIALRQQTRSFENWQDIFVGAEQDLARIAVPVGDGTVEIRGRVDAIRIHPERHLEVVDYKLSQGARQKADLVQLAIYAHLLPIWRPGCEFSGTLEYYLPEFQEVAVSPDELKDIFTGMVAPVLQAMFAGKANISHPGTAVAAPPAANPAPPAGPNPNALGTSVVDAFRSFNLTVECADVIEGPQLIRLRLTPGPGVKVSSLANRAADLQVKLGLAEPPLIKAGKGFVILDLPRPDPKPCLLKDALAGPLAAALKSTVSFPIGIDVEGNPIVADFADPNTCHALVAGSTGSGNSEWLKAMVASMLLRGSPEQVKIALIDPKILTFSGVGGSPYLWRPVATTLAEALRILRDAVKEMDARYQVLNGAGVVNLGDYIKSGKTDLPFLVLIFDEFADLILAGRDDKKEFEALVARIAGKGRAAGIHLVLATQRPDRAVVTGLIKSNLPLKVCLKVANAVNAQIVLDEPGAESLFGKGDLLCDLGRGLVRAQGLFIPQPEFLAALGRK